MPRYWESDWESLVVDASGLHFDGLTRAPLDQDWGCALEQATRDPHYLRHVAAHFPPGTDAEVWAAILEELGLGPDQAPGRPDLP